MGNEFEYSFFERKKLSMISKYLDDVQTATAEQVIIAAKQAIEEHPREWLLYYFLADVLQKVGRYAEAMPICQKTVELKPNDVRAPYTLATNYNMLTRAAWTAEEIRNAQRLIHMAREAGELVDADVSKSELYKLGIGADTAALQAIRWFERALYLSSDGSSKSQIRNHIETLYRRFPHLKA